MKSLQIAALFFCIVFILGVSPVQASIIFDWSQTRALSVEKRQEVERRFSKAAVEFLTLKYANLGPYDFVNSGDEFVVMILDGYRREFEAKAEYFPGVMGGTIFADPSFFDNLNVFQVGAFHELCHAYDYIMTDKMRKNIRFFMKVRHLVGIDVRKMRDWYQEYLVNNEKRAFCKEGEYINDLRSELSDEDYSLAMKHVTDGKISHGIK